MRPRPSESDAIGEPAARWERDGFRVLAYETREQSVRLHGAAAIFTHRSLTRSISGSGEETMLELEREAG